MSLSQSNSINQDKGILGIVMCGGLSTRMGHDKGLLKLDDKYWAQIIAEKFRRLNVEYVFSINLKQEDKYKMTLGENEIFVLDNSVFAGPMNGLMSVHKKFPKKNLIPIACDMLKFNGEALTNAIYYSAVEKSYSYFAVPIAFSNDYQPFGAIYLSKGLKTIRLKYANDNISMSKILRGGKTYTIVDVEEANYKNYNAPEDLL